MPRSLVRFLGFLAGGWLVAAAAGLLAAARFRKDAPPLPDPAADVIEYVAVLDSTHLASSATAFRGGRISCWYGSARLDLQNATLAPSGAVLEVRSVFGSVRVVVAPGVPVRVTGPAIVASRQDVTDSDEATPESPGLVVTGFTLFGDLQVVDGDADDDALGGRAQAARFRPSAAPGDADL